MATASETGSLFRMQHACFRIFGQLELVGSESDEIQMCNKSLLYFVYSVDRLRSGDVGS